MLMDAGQLGRVRTVARDARAAGLDALAASLAGGADATDRRQRGLVEVQRATALINQGADDAGRAALERATEIDPANARAWVMLADRLRMAGDSLGTAAALGHALTSPDSAIRADALDVAALVAVERGRLPEAAARFAEAQRLMPRDVRHYALEARARAAIGDRAGSDRSAAARTGGGPRRRGAGADAEVDGRRGVERTPLASRCVAQAPCSPAPGGQTGLDAGWRIAWRPAPRFTLCPVGRVGFARSAPHVLARAACDERPDRARCPRDAP